MSVSKLKLPNLEERLLKAPSPQCFTKWFEFDEFSYIAICDLAKQDIPELIRITEKWVDNEWLDQNWESNEEARTLPVIAWRALAELKATEAIEPLLDMCIQLDGQIEDWSFEEFRHVFAAMGDPAIPYLTSFLDDDSIGVESRIIALESLIKLGKPGCEDVSPESRSAIKSFFLNAVCEIAENPGEITDGFEAFDLDFVRVNSQVLLGLVELKITEAAASIEKAFSLNQFDVGMLGDWEDVRNELGLESLGLPMPEHPLDSMAAFRARRGIGIFSPRPLMDDGDPDEELIEDYIETAMNAFAVSAEGQKATDRNESLGWTATFLQYGMSYLGETVDTMSAADAEEIVFRIFPRKVSVDATEAEFIIFELNQFWRFVGREYQLPRAAKIANVFGEESVSRLHAELSDERNFGMAKSMVMMGKSAGFDMRSQSDLNQFMELYNSQLMSKSGQGGAVGQDPGDMRFDPAEAKRIPSPPPTAGMTAKERKAFNKSRQKKLANKRKKSR